MRSDVSRLAKSYLTTRAKSHHNETDLYNVAHSFNEILHVSDSFLFSPKNGEPGQGICTHPCGVYVCIVMSSRIVRVNINRVGLPNPARGQLDRENEHLPVPVRA